MKIVEARTPKHYEAAIELFEAYAAGLGIDLKFQKFDHELQALPQMYGPPQGELFLIENESVFIGCTAIRQLDDATCELKRMFIRPAFRGQHLGNELMEAAFEKARQLGYKTMRLDSLRRLVAAVKLYQKFGFVEISPYNFNPENDVVYFEKEIKNDA